MAAAVDAEVAKFRALQTEIQELRSSQQTLIGQQNENEMVKQELDLLDEDSATVYKMVGPVLMKNDVDDAKQTVDKRLEYITGELKKLDKKVEDAQTKASESGEKIQQMQSAMQQAAAEAARAVAQQHSQESS